MAFTSTLLPLAAPVNHYAPSSAETSDSGGDTSVSGRSSSITRPGLRTITMCRRLDPEPGLRQQPCLGFSLRGGREHSTGFFVSAVEKGSEAYLQGLTVGDQIIRVNGLPVEDATHREVLHLIQSHSNVTVKVRSVGMIPVKDSYSDSLTWRLVEPEPGGVLEPPDLPNSGFSNARLYINVAPKAKLGCGICKGPEWKPGIFVQFTKENSLARGAGLRPGDQIIQCNNVVFTPDTPFTEAVNVLRSTGLLELVIQKGAGVDLFPGESSGYNSSASSVAGDQSPETWPNKRLSIVKEESVIDSDSRLTCSELNRVGERHKDSDKIRPPSDNFPVNPRTTDGACTVIRVGPDVESYGENERNTCTKLAEICMVSQQLETKTTTVLVEVHQSGDEGTVNNHSDTSLCHLTNSSSASSFSSSGANSLCSAISQELQRRSEKRAKEESCGVKPTKVELHKCGMDKEKMEQHQQLMEEFRRAHKKMFAQTLNEDIKTDTSRPCIPLASQSKTERESFRLKRQQKEEQHAANMSQERVLVAVKERDIRLERDKQDMTEAERELTRLVRRQQSCIPPPPPPMPSDENVSNNQSSLMHNNFPLIDSNLPPLLPFPPDSPTPDYDKESLASEPCTKSNGHNFTSNSTNGSADFVEMQSLESFKLTNPSVSRPKPPSTYFQPNVNVSTTVSNASSNTSTDAKRAHITIREYPKNIDRKNPERFQFLNQNGGNQSANHLSDESITSRLQDELSETLSKANLKCESTANERSVSNKMTGKNTVTISINAQPNILQKQENLAQPNKQAPFYLHKNEHLNSSKNNINSSKETPRKISTTVINQTFINGNGVKSENITGKNCVSFNLGQARAKAESRSVTVIQPNGILKNSVGGSIAQVQTHLTQANKTPSKSIKFAGIFRTASDVQEPKK